MSPATTNREPALRLRDNPLLYGLTRRKLRWKRLLPGLIIVVVLGLCALLFGVTTHDQTYGVAWQGLTITILFSQGLFLYVWAPISASTTLSADRKSGMLDFHRAAPPSPWTNTFGYLVGSTALGHVLAGACLPFFLVSGLLGEMSFLGLLTVQAALWLSALLYHTVALLVAVLVRPGKAASGGAIVVVLALLIGAFPLSEGGLRLIAFLTPYPAIGSGLGGAASATDLAALGADLTLFGLPVHPLLATVIVQGSTLALCFWAVARRLGSDDAPVLPRLGATGALAWSALLLVAASWTTLAGGGYRSGEAVLLVLLTIGVGAAVSLVLLTPDHLRYRRALLRARKEGRRSVPPLRDNAENWAAWALLSAVFVAAYVLSALGSLGPVSFGHAFGAEAIATLLSALALLAFFASVVRYAWFVHRKAPAAFAVLVLFLALVLPWILWAVLTQASTRGGSLYLLAFDPVFAFGEALDTLLNGWAARQTDTLHWGPYVLSLAVTLGLTALLGWRTNGVAAAREARAGARNEEEG